MKLEHEKGETLQNLSEGDLVLYHSYGNILSIKTVQASYKDTVRVKNNKFRRKDGMQIPRNDYVWIMQYDHIAYQAYLAKKIYNKQRHAIVSIGWSQISQDQINQVYEYLKSQNIIK